MHGLLFIKQCCIFLRYSILGFREKAFFVCAWLLSIARSINIRGS